MGCHHMGKRERAARKRHKRCSETIFTASGAVPFKHGRKHSSRLAKMIQRLSVAEVESRGDSVR